VSPESNFITAIIVLFVVVVLAWEYIMRGRFKGIAFMRKYRVNRRLGNHAKSIAGYLFWYKYRGEAERIYFTSYRILRVLLFGFVGTIITVVMAMFAYLATMGSIVFKAMIVVVGLKMDLPFIDNLKGVVMALTTLFNLQWISIVLLQPFIAVITFLARFEIDLAFINVTCSGSTAPSKLLLNIFVMGVVTVLIGSEYGIFKSVTYERLIDQFRSIHLSSRYRIWNPALYDIIMSLSHDGEEKKSKYCVDNRGKTVISTSKKFSFHFLAVLANSLVMAIASSFDLFHNSLQFLASKVVLVDFISVHYMSHSWDENCNVIPGFIMFDTSIAIASSCVAWLLFFPAVYEISSILIPGLPKGIEPLAEDKTKPMGSMKMRYRAAWKYTSLVALDLWWAEFAYRLVNYVKRKTPYMVGAHSLSVAHAESLVVDPIAGAKEAAASRKSKKAKKKRKKKKKTGDDDGEEEEDDGDEEEGDDDDKGDVEAGESTPTETAAASTSQDILSANMSDKATAELARLETPKRKIFRVVSSIEGSKRKLRLFSCDRVVNEAKVWDEVVVEERNNGDGCSTSYTLMHIAKETGQVKSYITTDSASETADGLIGCDETSAIVFVKWGSSDADATITAMAVPMVAETEVDSEEGKTSSPLHATSIYGSNKPVDPAMQKLADAIECCGGDATKMLGTLSYVLLGAPLHIYYQNEVDLTCSVSYQQWYTEDGRTLEKVSELDTDLDITLDDDDDEEAHITLDIVFTTPTAPDEVRMEVIEDELRGYQPLLCFDRRSFITSSFRKRTTTEKIAWKENITGGLPSFVQLCEIEWGELKDMQCFSYFPHPLITFLIIIGLGHVATPVGRRAWYVVVWKCVRFVLLCFGYWTDDVVEMYAIHDTLLKYSLVWTHPKLGFDGEEETSDDIHNDADANGDGDDSNVQNQSKKGRRSVFNHAKETASMKRLKLILLKNMFREDYSRTIASLVSTRATILQLIPGLSILSIFASFTANAPMLVQSKELELNLPEIVCKDPKGMARKIESNFVDAVNHIRYKELGEDDMNIPISDFLRDQVNSHSNPVATVSLRNIELHNSELQKRMKRCMQQEPLIVKNWVVWLSSLNLAATKSRGFMFATELMKFALVLALLFGVKHSSYVTYIIISIAIIVPLSLLKTLSAYIIVGEFFAVTDDDLAYFRHLVMSCCGVATPSSASSAAKEVGGGKSGGGDSFEHGAEAEMDFGDMYPESEKAEEEITRSTMVVNPLFDPEGKTPPPTPTPPPPPLGRPSSARSSAFKEK
jgi:hypothetical protein